MSDVTAVAALAGLAGVLATDATAAFQIMVSQPLVAGTLAGAVLGDVGLGLMVGSTLQLVWLSVLPAGGAPFPDVGVASVVGVGLAVLLQRSGVSPSWAVGAGIAMALAAGAVGQVLTVGVRRLNGRFARMAESRAEHGDGGGVALAVALGLGSRLVAGALLAAFFIVAGLFVFARLPSVAPGRSFPTALWAAPLAAGSILVLGRGVLPRCLVGAGFVVGMLVVSLR